MGLDTVELVVAIEKEFAVRIPDNDAAKLAILGDMHAYLLALLERNGQKPDAHQVWQRLSAVVINQLGVKPEQVKRTSHIIRDLGAGVCDR